MKFNLKPADFPRSRVPALVVSVIGISAALVFLYFKNPEEQSFLPPCIFYKVTGFYCAGCGITRATHHLLHGRFFTAFDYNPLITLMLPFIIWDLYIFFHNLYAEKKLKSIMGDMVPAWILVVLVLAFWILRNLPFGPFTFLAP